MNEILKNCINSKDGVKKICSQIHIDVKKAKELLCFANFYFPFLLIADKKIKELNAKLKSNNILINEALELFVNLNADGKFLRGVLIALGYQNAGRNDEGYLDLMVAYESFQTAILIHDDVIDKGDKRRGKPTINAIYSDKFSNVSDYNHLSNSLSICIGDLGFYMANQIIVENYFNNSNLPNVLKYFNDIVMKTACGEFIDVYLPNDKNISNLEEMIMDVYKLKTGFYTIAGPYCLGMILGGKTDIEKYEDILIDIGIAYQIRDDIFGIYGKVGSKSVTSDIEEFKQTILYSYAIKTDYKDELLKYYGKKTGKEELKIVREILIKCGAKKYAEEKMKTLFARARQKIIDSDIINKDVLLGLIVYLEVSCR